MKPPNRTNSNWPLVTLAIPERACRRDRAVTIKILVQRRATGSLQRAWVLSRYCAGIVTSGTLSLAPVSTSVKKNMTAVSARFVRKSPSSTQNQ